MIADTHKRPRQTLMGKDLNRLIATQWIGVGLALAAITILPISASAQAAKPVALECESLITPLGMDAPHPQLSWKLQDSRDGAKQTAYQVQVASNIGLLSVGRPDVWDSGHIASGQSVGVIYGGAALKASTRYFWRVLVWDTDGKPYPPSDTTWWKPVCSIKPIGKPNGLAMKNQKRRQCANPAQSG